MNTVECKVYEVKWYESVFAWSHGQYEITKKLFIPKYKLCVVNYQNNIYVNEYDEKDFNEDYKFIKNINITQDLLDDILTIYNNKKIETLIKDFFKSSIE